MNLNVNIPVWATIILVIIWAIERLVALINSKSFQSLWYRVRILFLYHNDEEFYKQKLAGKKAKQALCRERYRISGKYYATSLMDLLNKNKKK